MLVYYVTLPYTVFYISLKVLCSLNCQDITGKYIQHTEHKQRSDLLRHSKPLSEDKVLAWKVLISNRWKLNKIYQ